MLILEYWARLIRFAFILVISIAGYIGIMSYTTNDTTLNFLKVMFFPFILSTIIIEAALIQKVYNQAKKNNKK